MQSLTGLCEVVQSYAELYRAAWGHTGPNETVWVLPNGECITLQVVLISWVNQGIQFTH